MKRIGMLVLAWVFMAGIALAEDMPAISVKSMPPSVIKTTPRAGDT